MQAEVGKWLVIRSSHLDVPVRVGRIVEISHPDGEPPYVVRWSDDEHTSVVFPGPDAVVVDSPPASAGSPHPG